MSIRLEPIKRILWGRVKSKIDAGNMPHSEHIEFVYEDNLISTRLEITYNTLIGLLDIDVFIEKLPVIISDKTGFVDIVFSIPSDENCSIDSVSIENWDEALDNVLADLQNQLVNDWNS